jgi:hypothetical protein
MTFKRMKAALPGRSLTRLILLAALIYTVAMSAYIAQREWEMRHGFRATADFVVFYDAGRLVQGEERQYLYDPGGYKDVYVPPTIIIIDGRAHSTGEPPNAAVGHFYNPPLYAFVFTPVAKLPISDARYLFNWLCAGFGLGLAALFGLKWRSWLTFLGACLVIASFWPAAEAVRIGHASLLFALIAALALVVAANRQVVAGLLVALLALKPPMFLGPGAAFFVRSDRKGLAALVAGLAVFIALPFFLISPDAVFDYQRLLSASREDAFSIFGGVTAGALWMFNWNGFWAYALADDPPVLLVFLGYAVTAALAVKVLMSGRIWEGWLASTIAATLIVPHFLFYDLAILLPPMLALALHRRDRPDILALVLVVHAAANVSVALTFPMSPFMRPEQTLLPYPLVALAALAYLAFAGERAPVRQETETAPAPA